MSDDQVFLSYCHEDQKFLEELLTMLAPLRRIQSVPVWWDGEISSGDLWRRQIDLALSRARVALLLVSPGFLASDYITQVELPYLIDAAQREQVTILWVLVRNCLWDRTPLEQLQAAWKDPPLASLARAKRDDAWVTICSVIETSFQASSLTPERRTLFPAITTKVQTDRLDVSSSLFVGRQEELRWLNEVWATSVIKVASILGWAGVGKTALLRSWLTQMAKEGYRGAERVYGWSFLSNEGLSVEGDTGEEFLTDALNWFGDDSPEKGSAWDRGRRLADLVSSRSTLLVLDGVDALQHPTGSFGGSLKDKGVVALLDALAAHSLRSIKTLCIVTSKAAVRELDLYYDNTMVSLQLRNLPRDAAVRLLKESGVTGPIRQLEEATEYLDGHALSLTLVGHYIRRAHRGRITSVKEMDLENVDRLANNIVETVLGTYEIWLQSQQAGKAFLLLCILSLFEERASLDLVERCLRPRNNRRLRRYLSSRQGSELTNRGGVSVGSGKEMWAWATSVLQELGLGTAVASGSGLAIQIHPLIRAHFSRIFRSHAGRDWRRCHKIIYKHLKREAKELPPERDRQKVILLLLAVRHACEAKSWIRGYLVYRRHVGKAIKHLGLLENALSALQGFFGEPWTRPALRFWRKADFSTLVYEAGFLLEAVGRPEEALVPMTQAYDYVHRRGYLRNIAVGSSGLSDLHLLLGNLGQARSYAEEGFRVVNSVAFAHPTHGDRTIWPYYCQLAHVVHNCGSLEEAQGYFEAAEQLQEIDVPASPVMYSTAGYQYCDFLTTRWRWLEYRGPEVVAARDNFESALGRAMIILDNAQGFEFLVDMALAHVIIGRSRAVLGLMSVDDAKEVGLGMARREMDAAVTTFRKAGSMKHLPLGLLARAGIRCITGDFEGSKADLEELFSLCRSSGLMLYLTDAHLEAARVSVRLEDYGAAHGHLQEAAGLVERTGYHRRDSEVLELRQVLLED